MNRIYSHLFLLSLLILIACGSNELNQDSLSGKWNVIDFTVKSTKLSPALIQGGKQEAISSIYVFEENKINLTSDALPDGMTGKWQYDTVTQMIQFNYDGSEKPETYKVTLFEGDKMVWTQDMGELGTLEMTLKKA